MMIRLRNGCRSGSVQSGSACLRPRGFTHAAVAAAMASATEM